MREASLVGVSSGLGAGSQPVVEQLGLQKGDILEEEDEDAARHLTRSMETRGERYCDARGIHRVNRSCEIWRASKQEERKTKKKETTTYSERSAVLHLPL